MGLQVRRFRTLGVPRAQWWCIVPVMLAAPNWLGNHLFVQYILSMRGLLHQRHLCHRQRCGWCRCLVSMLLEGFCSFLTGAHSFPTCVRSRYPSEGAMDVSRVCCVCCSLQLWMSGRFWTPLWRGVRCKAVSCQGVNLCRTHHRAVQLNSQCGLKVDVF